jgi:DNA-directed RNA polymerase specialized sigma24 family protein
VDLYEIAQSQKEYALILTKNIEDAKDLLSDVTLKILLSKNKPDHSHQQMVWFFRCCMKRLAIDFYRKRQKTRAFISEYDQQVSTMQVPEIIDLPWYIKSLEPAQASILLLHAHGFTNSEICALKGYRSKSSVAPAISISKRKLRELRCQQDQ